MLANEDDVHIIRDKLIQLNEIYFNESSDISDRDLKQCLHLRRRPKLKSLSCLVLSFFIVLVACNYSAIVDSFYGTRCLVANNYLIWEATRPISDCNFCRGMTRPVILRNITKEDFKKYAYGSKPIIVKEAIKHWKAMSDFDYDLFKNLYESTKGSYESVDEGCQFLNFKSDVFSLKEVFEMPTERARNLPGQKPWYVGWGNCHPDILSVMRNYYSIPDFLPDDAEFPNSENIFFGYEIGAVMHLDYIPRLMWQGQVKGNKTWTLVPIPECEGICGSFEFFVEPGDVVLLDTRIWYHATRIPPGEFSLTVQSEYG